MDLNLGLTARRRKVFVLVFALAEGGAICRRSAAAGGSGSGWIKTRRRRVSGYGDLAGALGASRHFEQFLGMLVVFCAAGGRVRLAVGTCRPRRRFV